jgi:hypothetical protein
MNKLVKFAILLIVMVLIYTVPVLADQPPDPGGEPTNGTPVGGSPIGGGFITLMIAGLFYGIQKFRMAYKK